MGGRPRLAPVGTRARALVTWVLCVQRGLDLHVCLHVIGLLSWRMTVGHGKSRFTRARRKQRPDALALGVGAVDEGPRRVHKGTVPRGTVARTPGAALRMARGPPGGQLPPAALGTRGVGTHGPGGLHRPEAAERSPWALAHSGRREAGA
jgi:hypothetical protein